MLLELRVASTLRPAGAGVLNPSCGGGRKMASLHPVGFLTGLRIKIDIKQISKRKPRLVRPAQASRGGRAQLMGGEGGIVWQVEAASSAVPQAVKG